VGSLTVVPALIWGGVRRFRGLPTPLPLLAAGTMGWVAMVLLPVPIDHQKWSTLAGFASWTGYLCAAVWTLGGATGEKLNARRPLAALLALRATMFFGAGCEILFGVFPLNEPARLDTFFGAVHFETILYTMGTAIFMVLICKERVELGYLVEARVDALTGAANRGAIFEDAARLFGRCRREGRPFSLIMLDLDHFKTVNDTLGHQAGDRLLRCFADTVRGALRPSDLVGRYGGEEFIVVLPGTTAEIAHAMAERVRHAFAASNKLLDGWPLDATVSAGVASASPGMTLEALIGAADEAMYAAKKAGRNRVECAGAGLPSNGGEIVAAA
jgi:diguanylate cyclase (GGDEF)-like protein